MSTLGYCMDGLIWGVVTASLFSIAVSLSELSGEMATYNRDACERFEQEERAP